jgi:hypothetical protein
MRVRERHPKSPGEAIGSLRQASRSLRTAMNELEGLAV